MSQSSVQRSFGARPHAPAFQRGLHPVGRALVRQGLLGSRALMEAEARSDRTEERLVDTLRVALDLPQEDIARAEADVAGAALVDPVAQPPNPTLVSRMGAGFCARNGVLPWRRSGGVTIVLCTRPDEARRLMPELKSQLGEVSFALTTHDGFHAALQSVAGKELVDRAEARVPAKLSCRGWRPSLALGVFLAFGLVLALCAYLAPNGTLVLVTGWAVTTLALTMALKLASLVLFVQRKGEGTRQSSGQPLPLRQPVVSVLVPLLRERAIASHLLDRVQQIDYPHELLDICLVLEADDRVTRATIAGVPLPPWIRCITVPPGTLKTKPRALNYALDFARGSIIGIWDAEDAPAADQIRKVAAQFANADRQVACLQGVLDYYNSRTNWLSRCFTLEYATWFRVMLPGMARMGLVLPLGGTTMFMRRDVVEELGGWDAHNVTEDADLGVRLARAGYRTELIDTVTGEEANCRAWPWVKQRSRWLKGYALTYGVHMRRPARLLSQLGWWRFLGVQVVFLGSLSQVVLAPLLWSFWAVPFGLPHPVVTVIGPAATLGLGALFLSGELLNIVTAALAVRASGKPDLALWAPTLHFYFPLAAVAAYKGLSELMSEPFFWDKTVHGLFVPAHPPIRPRPDSERVETAIPRPPRRSANA